MKTKQFLTAVVTSILVSACTTDDITLNREIETLGTTENQSRMIDFEYHDEFNEMSECVYNDYFYVYYSNSSIHLKINLVTGKLATAANVKRIHFLREDFILNEIENPTLNGCPKYDIPANPIYKYDQYRDQYYETWNAINLEKDHCKGCPGGSLDEIEL